ncbi:ATP-binding protein [Arthrobacter sp. S41]|uniref:ATP-binding protein n=1 Tax=Arthrobacter sp. S41 TaxID=2509721 RepID=UPI001035E690|nr:ATP-binding protein [Arthrobacter sp. S41]TAP26831.1 hypothetical protein EYR88_00225 [Arthrobacter sp. S41]
MTKINELEIKNFQKIEAARVAPSNHLIVFAGKNAQGKSSALNAIEAALTGHNSRNNPRPIREGAKRGSAKITLDNGLTIDRRYTSSGTTLTVKSEDGGKHGQSKLSDLIGNLGIDVSQFTILGEKQQRAALLDVVQLPFSPSELDARRKSVFDSRTDVNAEVRKLTALANDLPAVSPNVPEVEVSFAELAEQFRQGEELNRRIDQADERVTDEAGEVNRLRYELQLAESRLREAREHALSAPERVDTEAIQVQINSIEETNRAVRDNNRAKRVRDDLAGAQASADKLTATLEEIDQTKNDGLAQAIFPVPGLAFDEEGLLYNGVPFSRASDAEKVLVSAAMMIAREPELRTLIVRNGNNLDEAHLNELRLMAEHHDFQIFVELVAETGNFEYVFHEGNLAE